MFNMNTDMTPEELAALWNQHEICPECGGSNIKDIINESFIKVAGVIKTSYNHTYRCEDCNCKWITAEPHSVVTRNRWTGESIVEVKV